MYQHLKQLTLVLIFLHILQGEITDLIYMLGAHAYANFGRYNIIMYSPNVSRVGDEKSMEKFGIDTILQRKLGASCH